MIKLLSWILCGFLLSFSSGFFTASHVYNPIKSSLEFVPTTFEQYNHIYQRITPTTIILHFVSPEEFNKIKPDKNTYAFSRMDRNPCEIYMQAGNYIRASVDIADGAFVESYDNEALPHEILHCLIGNWHGSIQDVQTARLEYTSDTAKEVSATERLIWENGCLSNNNADADFVKACEDKSFAFVEKLHPDVKPGSPAFIFNQENKE